MNKILLQHLSNQDYTGVSYKAVSKQLGNRLTNMSNTSEELFSFFSTLGSFEGDVIVTILSHGFKNRGIAHGTCESFVTWAELILSLNNIITNGKLILNLIAVCKSNSIATMAGFCNHRVDEIWVSTNEVISIEKALLAEKEMNFLKFHSWLEEDEKILYTKINCR